MLLAPYDVFAAGKPIRRDISPREIDETWERFSDLGGSRTDPCDTAAVLTARFDHDVRSEVVDGERCFYFIENENPHAKFDTILFGGHWSHHFKPKDPDDRRLITANTHPSPRLTQVAPPPGREAWVIGGPKGALDIEGTRAERAAAAATRWGDDASVAAQALAFPVTRC